MTLGAAAPSATMTSPQYMPAMHRNNSSHTPTEVLSVSQAAIHFIPSSPHLHPFDSPSLYIDCPTTKAHLQRAASVLRQEGDAVAFPTETVYGLGADATNDEAVKKIFKAKNRPSDNPLIVHIASLQQLRELLRPTARPDAEEGSSGRNSSLAGSPSSPTVGTGHAEEKVDPVIPEVYLPLIEKFWPGPLTILLNLPANTPLSKNVTAEQTTFAVRLPDHPIALALAHLSNLPIAAPSANASGKPSPTTAAHVHHDLEGRIPLILDGGPSNVGLESTVVSGLCNPPRILRPGGVSVEQIRACGGVWASCLSSAKASSGDAQVEEENIPLVPGMKYKHYSPKARVFLYEPGAKPPSGNDLARSVRWNGNVGILRTRMWRDGLGTKLISDLEEEKRKYRLQLSRYSTSQQNGDSKGGKNGQLESNSEAFGGQGTMLTDRELEGVMTSTERLLGIDGADISRRLFATLRELDDLNVAAIHVEGITDDHEGLAVMNRLRKAASVVIRRVG
ncbi:telomere recombination-domain-containing protein [Peziza echinospora]|nr:telomere recombination-domain-containing protein [Peziza echinospora]